MNYEEKYKQALERAKDMLAYKEVRQEDMEYLFPELKESEDERIRKGLVKAFGTIGKKDWGGLIVRDILDWLEKQQPLDKEKLAEEILKSVARRFMNWLDASTPKDKMCLSNMECEDIEDAFLKDDWARIAHYMKKKLEKQVEQIELKEVEQDNHPRIVMADFNGGEGFYKLNLDNLNKEQVNAIEIMINNPKQGKKLDPYNQLV